MWCAWCRSGRSSTTTYTLYAMPGEKCALDGRRSCSSWVRLPPIKVCGVCPPLHVTHLHLSAGYQCEVDALLCVSSQSQFSHEEEHLSKAVKLLEQLLDHTSLFPAETGHQSRYLCVMVHTHPHTSTHTHTHFSFITFHYMFGTPNDLCSSSHCSIPQERLVSLDSAEDFVRLAKEKYPKKG